LKAFDLRAADACWDAMYSGSLCERHIRDVLKCREVHTLRFEQFLDSDDRMVRIGAARIIAAHGDVSVIVKALPHEEDRSVLLDMLMLIGDTGTGFDDLGVMLSSDDDVIRDEAIEVLRRTGKADALLPLIFERDDILVERIKRYMNEQED